MVRIIEPCTSATHEAGRLRRVGILVDGAPHRHAASPALHDAVHLVEDGIAARRRARATEAEDGHAHAGHHAGHGTLASRRPEPPRAPGP